MGFQVRTMDHLANALLSGKTRWRILEVIAVRPQDAALVISAIVTAVKLSRAQHRCICPTRGPPCTKSSDFGRHIIIIDDGGLRAGLSSQLHHEIIIST